MGVDYLFAILSLLILSLKMLLFKYSVRKVDTASLYNNIYICKLRINKLL